MKVVAINGSPKKEGNTAQALKVLLGEVEEKGIETELITIGHKDIRGCIGCGRCRDAQNGTCVAFSGDTVNEVFPKLAAADAIVLGSPTYFAGVNGTMKAFLDRIFYVSFSNGGLFRLKYGTAVAVLRRGGGTAAFDELNKFFQISEMTIASGCYWSGVHGLTPGEMQQDLEGLKILRTQGRNLAYLLQLSEYGHHHIAKPDAEPPLATNFVR